MGLKKAIFDGLGSGVANGSQGLPYLPESTQREGRAWSLPRSSERESKDWAGTIQLAKEPHPKETA